LIEALRTDMKRLVPARWARPSTKRGRRDLPRLPVEPRAPSDIIADQESQQLLRDKVGEFKKTLGGKDQSLMRDEEPARLQEIGDEVGISRERVRQIESRLNKKLGAYLREQIPDIEDVECGA